MWISHIWLIPDWFNKVSIGAKMDQVDRLTEFVSEQFSLTSTLKLPTLKMNECSAAIISKIQERDSVTLMRR